MSSKLIGYARVSTTGQDYSRQVEDLLAAGVRDDDIYSDKVSGALKSRPGLDACLNALQSGDTLVITTLDRLGRSTGNMLALADDLQNRGVALRVLNLGGAAVDTSTATGKLLFTMLSALAEMEREIKTERIRDGIAKAKAKGTLNSGRPRVMNDDLWLLLSSDIESGLSIAKACKKRGVGEATYYREKKRRSEMATE